MGNKNIKIIVCILLVLVIYIVFKNNQPSVIIKYKKLYKPIRILPGVNTPTQRLDPQRFLPGVNTPTQRL